jgi:hypothetical protein
MSFSPASFLGAESASSAQARFFDPPLDCF